MTTPLLQDIPAKPAASRGDAPMGVAIHSSRDLASLAPEWRLTNIYREIIRELAMQCSVRINGCPYQTFHFEILEEGAWTLARFDQDLCVVGEVRINLNRAIARHFPFLTAENLERYPDVCSMAYAIFDRAGPSLVSDDNLQGDSHVRTRHPAHVQASAQTRPLFEEASDQE